MGTAQLLNCYCATMRQTARAVTQVYNLALRPAEIEITHYTLLAMLDANPGLTTGDLAGLLVMDQTTVTRTLRLMERAGLIAWQPGLDRRNKRWSLTAAGTTKLRAAEPLWRTAQETVHLQFGGARAEDLHQLSFALTAVLAS